MKHIIQTTQMIHSCRDMNGDVRFTAFAADMSEYGYTLLTTVDVPIEFELPDDFNHTVEEIKSLKKEKQRVLADAQKKATEIEEQIQSLLCIEHKE